MMQDKVDVEIRLSLLDLLQDLIPSININDQSKANYVLYYFEFFFNNVVMEEASSMIGNKGTFFKGFSECNFTYKLPITSPMPKCPIFKGKKYLGYFGIGDVIAARDLSLSQPFWDISATMAYIFR